MGLGEALIAIGLLSVGGLVLWLVWPELRRRESDEDAP